MNTQTSFGNKQKDTEYTTRIGVYAVIPDEDKEKIVLIQAPNGAWFLPGGEIEEGENHLTALQRELLEELGFTGRIGQYYGQADEYFYSRHRDTHFYHPAHIYHVTNFQKLHQPLEDFNRIAWFPIDQAIDKLKRDSHKWGINQWKLQEKKESN